MTRKTRRRISIAGNPGTLFTREGLWISDKYSKRKRRRK